MVRKRPKVLRGRGKSFWIRRGPDSLDPQFVLKGRDPASEHVENITLYSSDPDFVDSTWHVKNDQGEAVRLDVEAKAGGYRTNGAESRRYLYKIEIPAEALDVASDGDISIRGLRDTKEKHGERGRCGCLV